MSSIRLPSILSAVCRNHETYNPALRSARAAQRIRMYHPTWRIQQDAIPQRYGTANEPPPHVKAGEEAKATSKQADQPQEAKAQPKIGEMAQGSDKSQVRTEAAPSSETADKKEPTTIDGGEQQSSATTTDPMLDASSASKSQQPDPPPTFSQALDDILADVKKPPAQATSKLAGASSDATQTADEHTPPIKPPHLDQPRYIHHFDTYSLVKQLKDSTWNSDQAITIMKAMRVILTDKTDLAKEAMVSKSNLENEAYLFKAACAELRTEVMARRRSEQEKLRTERTQLQHEVDILSQRLGQESTSLKDELKGLFDDRKMAVRNEQRDMESKIQQLNYRITVDLSADGKSEVEGLRWIMTRRVILTLGLVVMMIVGSLKAAATSMESSASAAKEKERAVTVSGGTQTEGGGGGGGGGSDASGGYESLG